ncbi:MAG: ABC transporter substrate-binding protein [Clostridiales bacterium]|nr:ABC transporter substrate-binding protein [Clostridiales bacterium]
MKRRKAVSLALVLIMVLTAILIAGCGGGGETTTPPAATEAPTGGTASATDAPPASTDNVETIKIGVIYALTGASAATGVDQQSAIQLGFDIVNGSYADVGMPYAETEGIPSMGGAKIELIFANSEGDPEKGASEAERLIQQEGVSMLMGCYQSSVVASASQVAERAGIPFFVVESSSPSLTSRGFKYLFRQGPHDAMIGESIFDFLDSIKDEHGIRRIAMVYDNSTYGTDAAASWTDNCERRGYEVVESLPYPSNTVNMTSEIQRIKAANPDLVLAASYVSDATLIMTTLKELDYMPGLIANNTGFTESTFFTMMGADTEYIVSRLVYCSDYSEINPRAAAIEKLFNERTGIDNMNDNTARAVQSAFVVADVLDRAGSTDPEAIREAFIQTDIPNEKLLVPWTKIAFNEQGQNENALALLCQVQGGKYVTVWPESFATQELIWPIPGWSER